MIEITESRLKELERSQAKLDALEAGGVNNWENYYDSLAEYNAENEREEYINYILQALEEAFTTGAYEPSERGAGFCASQQGREDAFEILTKSRFSLIAKE